MHEFLSKDKSVYTTLYGIIDDLLSQWYFQSIGLADYKKALLRLFV